MRGNCNDSHGRKGSIVVSILICDPHSFMWVEFLASPSSGRSLRSETIDVSERELEFRSLQQSDT